MADEQAPENQDKPDQPEAAPEQQDEGSGQATESKEYFSDSFNPEQLPEELRGQYDSMRADYTRKTQEIAEQRREAEQAQAILNAIQNPATQAQALAVLGLELEEDADDEDDYRDPEDEIADIKEYLAAQEEQQALAQAEDVFFDGIAEGIEQIEQREKRELSNEEQQFILAHAQAALADGEQPDVNVAFEMLKGIEANARERYVKSKKAAPPAPLGSAGDRKINLDDPEERIRALAQIAEQSLSEE